jgi:hypothetical protein
MVLKFNKNYKIQQILIIKEKIIKIMKFKLKIKLLPVNSKLQRIFHHQIIIIMDKAQKDFLNWIRLWEIKVKMEKKV